jgi:hypothetical protein
VHPLPRSRQGRGDFISRRLIENIEQTGGGKPILFKYGHQAAHPFGPVRVGVSEGIHPGGNGLPDTRGPQDREVAGQRVFKHCFRVFIGNRREGFVR